MPVARTGDNSAPRYTKELRFDCRGACRVYGSLDFDDDARAARNCSRADFDTNNWNGSELIQIRLGAPPDYAREDETPFENIEDNGCPAGWWDQNKFISSILPYRRSTDANGGRIDTHRYNSCTDPFLWDCLRILESEETAADIALTEQMR